MDRLYVQLCFTGDVVGLLPILWLDHQEGKSPGMMVHEKYASVLEGVSYVEPVIWKGDPLAIRDAAQLASSMCADVRCTQIGSFDPAQNKKESFLRDSWRLAGRDGAWKDQPPLVFDRRNKERESELIKKHVPAKKKFILVSAHGRTSPIPEEHRDFLFEILRLKYPKFAIIDLATIQAERFFDLLGLFERAHCLVSIDTAHLHLAPAVKTLPVVALTNDRPSLWNGSPWRPNHICHIRYSDFPSRAFDMLRCIDEIGSDGNWFNVTGTVTQSPRIFHTWSQYEINPRNKEGRYAAATTWGHEYGEHPEPWVSCRIDIGALGQDSGKALSNGHRIESDKRYPFLKEMIRLAMLRAKDDDIILVTRCDTCLEQGFTEKLLKSKLPVFCHRITRTDEGDSWHPAFDAFAFTKSFWNEHKKECPDLICGTDAYWHRCFAEFLRLRGGRELPDSIFRLPPEPAPIVQKVPSRELHNEGLTNKFLEANDVRSMAPRVSEQLDTISVNRRALHPYGYNPSIIMHGDKLLMVYRWHDKNSPQTTLSIAEMDSAWNVISNSDIQVIGAKPSLSVEDGRLFMFKGELHICYVLSDWPQWPPKCVMVVSKLWKEHGTWRIKANDPLPFKGNDWSGMQKNYVPFEHNGEIFFVYQSSPTQLILNESAKTVFETPALRWKYGPVRGGTSPMPFDGKLLRFFHSGIDTELRPYTRRYFVGALLTEPEPPFKQVAISKEPVLIGSELDDMEEIERNNCFHTKQKVVFPMGAVANEKGWLLSVGINDAQCSIVNVTPKDLKF